MTTKTYFKSFRAARNRSKREATELEKAALRVKKAITVMQRQHDAIPFRANMTAAQLSKNVDRRMAIRVKMMDLLP